MTPPATLVKICGLSDDAGLEAALAAGADMVGFVFFAPSPRHIEPAVARALGRAVRGRARKVALTVDADDAALATVIEALDPDILQLHGRESPERVAAVRARFGLPVMRALAMAGKDDLARVERFEGIADYFLFDAAAPQDAVVPGGNGAVFDWSLLAGVATRTPWLLAGGLTAETVASAIRATGAPGVDVSSGVETTRGVKDVAKIARFVAAVRRNSAEAWIA